MFQRYGSDVPSEDVILTLIQRVVDPDYDLDYAVKTYGHVVDDTAYEGSHVDDTSDVQTSQNNASSWQNNSRVIEHVFNTEIIDGFEHAAKRPMTVYEYQTYTKRYDTRDETPDWLAVWKQQNTSYNHLRNIVHDYCEITLFEHEFLKMYLDTVENPGFDDMFIQKIINSTNYENNMKLKLSKIYKDTLDVDMSQIDVDYLFQHVKRDRMRIVDPELHGVITDFVKTTNNIIAHASEVYSKVLDRYPDDVEIVEIVSMYRENANRPMEAIGKSLEKSLIHTLEFQDVLRQRIQKVAQIQGVNLIPSRLYAILREMLSKLDDITMENLQSSITEFLK